MDSRRCFNNPQRRQMLARLLAERGKIDEAITLFEACKKNKLLTAADYRMLADWYLVSNRRNEYEQSRIESYRQMPEDTLAQMLYQIQNRWSRNDMPLPSELSEDTLFALKALFEKSASPENYFYQVRALYGRCPGISVCCKYYRTRCSDDRRSRCIRFYRVQTTKSW